MSDAAIAQLVYGAITIFTMLVGFWQMRAKLKYGVEKAEEAATKAKVVEKKIDANTQLTKDGTEAAAANAKEAAEAVTAAAKKAEDANTEKMGILKEIAEQTNGKLGQNIKEAVGEAIKPLQSQLAEHDKVCDDDRTRIDKVITSLDSRLTTIEKYAHDSKHDLNGALQTQINKLDLIVKILEKNRE